jgi:hypothetical protein
LWRLVELRRLVGLVIVGTALKRRYASLKQDYALQSIDCGKRCAMFYPCISRGIFGSKSGCGPP